MHVVVEKVRSVKALGEQAWQTELKSRAHMKKSDVVTQINNPSTGDGGPGGFQASHSGEKVPWQKQPEKPCLNKGWGIAPSKCCSLTL